MNNNDTDRSISLKNVKKNEKHSWVNIIDTFNFVSFLLKDGANIILKRFICTANTLGK